MRQAAGYYGYDTGAERLLRNKIWFRQALLTSYFHPQQKPVSKVGHRAKARPGEHALSADDPVPEESPNTCLALV